MIDCPSCVVKRKEILLLAFTTFFVYSRGHLSEGSHGFRTNELPDKEV